MSASSEEARRQAEADAGLVPDGPNERTAAATMTMRDLFASSALHGLLAANGQVHGAKLLAKQSYEYADAMMVARDV